MSKVIDFNNPVMVKIELTSPTVDFLMDGYGWMESVKLNYLPPYDTTQEKVVSEVLGILNKVSVVPFDNVAGLEEYVDAGTKALKFLVEEVGKRLTTPGVYTASIQETNKSLMSIKVTITERNVTPELAHEFK